MAEWAILNRIPIAQNEDEDYQICDDEEDLEDVDAQDDLYIAGQKT